MTATRKKSALSTAIIVLSSCYFIYSFPDEDHFWPVMAMLIMIVASFVLYQTLFKYFPDNGWGILAFFFGRLLFAGALIAANAWICNKLSEKWNKEDGVKTYAIAGRISSDYRKGRYEFYRHYYYRANGLMVEKRMPFNKEMKTGDTLYLKYSASHPFVVEFEAGK